MTVSIEDGVWAVMLADKIGPYDLQSLFRTQEAAETAATRQRESIAESMKPADYLWVNMRGRWWVGHRAVDIEPVRVVMQRVCWIPLGRLRERDPWEPSLEEITTLLQCERVKPEFGYLPQHDR